MNSYGVVLRKLRELKKMPLKKAAKHIGRSPGWLSEIENCKGQSRLSMGEFERIVAAYDGQAYRKQFGAWIAHGNKPKHLKKDIGFDGAILRYLREKSKMSLEDAAHQISRSATHLCNLEKGKRAISIEIRDQLLRLYGYQPSSYRNFTTADKRARNIPARYKLEILLNQMSPEAIESLLALATKSTDAA